MGRRKFEDISTGREVVKYHIMRSSCLRLGESHILKEIHPIKVMGGLIHEIEACKRHLSCEGSLKKRSGQALRCTFSRFEILR